MAYKWGMVSRNVATLVDPPQGERPEVQPLTPQQAQAFLDAVRGHRWAGLFIMCLAVGLRQGEALGLRWEDIDMEQGLLRVRVALQRIEGKLQLVEPKTRRSKRTIPLPKVASAALRARRLLQLEERLLAGPRWQETGLVFTSTIGTPVDARSLVREYHAILESASLPHRRFHDLRHTCASLLLWQEVHPRVVMEALGHSQISLTMDTYSHVMPETLKKAADQMDLVLTSARTA